MKPVIVYISGAPGSGKTTLARLLSEQLYIPHVSSDLIHGGVAFLNPSHDRKETLLNVFVPTMVDMSKKGISFIADHVLQKGVSESDIIDKLKPHANIVYIHTKTSDPISRYVHRVKTSDLPSFIERREHLLSLATPHKENLSKTNEPLDLGVPTIVVNTDNGYEPILDKLVELIKQNTKYYSLPPKS